MNTNTETSTLALLANEPGYDLLEDRLRLNIRATIEAVFEEEYRLSLADAASQNARPWPCIVHKQRDAGRRKHHRHPPAAPIVAAQTPSNSPGHPVILALYGAPICDEWAERTNARARLFLA